MSGRGLIRNIVFVYIGWKLILMAVTKSVDTGNILLFGLIIFLWSAWWLLEMAGILPKMG
ncbi:MAG: hypothetical protein KAR23_05835 [Candidatus Aenigmarchaeota archaeon]|nr:hypothetical protein [Candidatus Aenigmarchaeota archaeon]MCK5234852.1 hypothetical protein [Candidatus Aenigmarchaeota archaeon]